MDRPYGRKIRITGILSSDAGDAEEKCDLTIGRGADDTLSKTRSTTPDVIYPSNLPT